MAAITTLKRMFLLALGLIAVSLCVSRFGSLHVILLTTSPLHSNIPEVVQQAQRRRDDEQTAHNLQSETNSDHRDNQNQLTGQSLQQNLHFNLQQKQLERDQYIWGETVQVKDNVTLGVPSISEANITGSSTLVEKLRAKIPIVSNELKKDHIQNGIHKAPRNNCQELLDDVKPGQVTGEGKTFTDEQLDMSQFANREPLIPHILHQTWDTYNIPRSTVPWVKSILRHNPTWDYWFWTQADVKCYLSHKHPQYLKLYNSYYAMIFKTDVMRYFLLWDYGGIYLDMDVECLKPLDVWTHLAPAVLSHETYEHSFVMHRLDRPNVMTTILATRAHHPYYKLLQENLEKFHKAKPSDVLHSTGPYFLNDIYNLYASKYSHNSGNGTGAAENDILVIHPKYWLPTHDNMNMNDICSCALLRDGAFLKKKPGEKIKRTPDTLQICKAARDKNFENKPDPESYLDHHWVHTNLKGGSYKTKDLVDIRTVVPNLVPVSKKLGLDCS